VPPLKVPQGPPAPLCYATACRNQYIFRSIKPVTRVEFWVGDKIWSLKPEFCNMHTDYEMPSSFSLC